jgi:hypothetical protein
MPIQRELVLAGKFLSESLTEYEPQLIETVYPEFWGYNGKYHNAKDDLPLGALKYATSRIDYTGRAVNFGGKANSIPLANFGINMDEYPTLVGILAAEWNFIELQAAEMAKKNPWAPQVDVIEEYGKALHYGLQQWMHIRTVFGDRTAGFTGLINNPFVEVVEVLSAANGVTGPSATAATAYEWFRTQLSAFRKASRLTADATIAMVSEEFRAALQRRFTDVSGDGTPELLLTSRQNSPALREINTVNEFSGDLVRSEGGFTGAAALGGVTLSDDNFDLVLFTENSVAQNVIRHYYDIDKLPPAPLDDGITFRQVGLCATSAVIFKKPFCARLFILRR